MTFLDDVVPEIRRVIEQSGYGSGIPPTSSGPPPSLRQAVERDRSAGALVVEYKRASPGQPDPVLPFRTVSEFLEATRAAPVTAYSCLATVPRFHGAPGDVAEMVRSTDRPVLFKDIVIDHRQVDVAARTGASAVLLIARLEGQGRAVEPLSSLAEAAHRRGLEVVVEFHDRADLSRRADVAADVYGVNARNLDTLSIDRARADATLQEAHALGLHPLLGMSGVEQPSDARRFFESGADGILVGGAVARARSPNELLRSLRRDLSGGTG